MDVSIEELQLVAGSLLADANTDEDIVARLIEAFKVTQEQAVAAIKDVYRQWSGVSALLDLGNTDLLNWHAHMRMRILRDSLRDPSVPSQGLALKVLDSLAALQGFGGTQEPPKRPLMIILKPKG
jgi:hypothetical protein